jgi:hypothetical protein
MVFIEPTCPYPEHHPKCGVEYVFVQQRRRVTEIAKFTCDRLAGHSAQHHDGAVLGGGKTWKFEWTDAPAPEAAGR